MFLKNNVKKTHLMTNQTSSNNNTRIAKNTFLLYFRMLFMMVVSLYTSRIILNNIGSGRLFNKWEQWRLAFKLSSEESSCQREQSQTCLSYAECSRKSHVCKMYEIVNKQVKILTTQYIGTCKSAYTKGYALNWALTQWFSSPLI